MLRRETLGWCTSAFFFAIVCSPLLSEPPKTVELDGDWLFTTEHDPQFARPEWNDSKWLKVQAPKPLKGQHPDIKSGNGWYRRSFSLDQTLKGQDLAFVPGGVSGSFEVYLNGKLIGKNVARSRERRCFVPANIVQAPGRNVLAIRVSSRDGMQSGKIQLLPADAEVRKAVLSEYVRLAVRLEVTAPPLAGPEEKSVKLGVTVENPGPFNPAVDGAKAQLLLRQPESEPVSTTPLRLVPEREQSFELSVPLREGAWEVALTFEGEATNSQSLQLLDYLRPLSGLAVDPRSLWIKDAGGRIVTLFAGQPAERTTAPLKKKQPTIMNLTSAILWDDYYLPSRRDGHFVEQFARSLRGGVEVVDASYQGLPLLLLPDLQRIVVSSRPDIIVLSIGEHEHYFSPSQDHFQHALEAIVRTLKAATTSQLVLVTPPPSLKDRAISRPFAEATKRLAKSHGLPLIDSAEVFDEATDSLETLYDRMSPNEEAHALIAAELGKVLSKGELRKILKRDEYVQAELETPGKAITLIDGQMPAAPDVPKNVQWGEAGGRKAHWHEGNERQTEHYFVNGDPLLVPNGSKLAQEVLIDSESEPKALMLVFRSGERNQDAQGIDYFHRHSTSHGIFWGEDLISHNKGQTGKPARINGGAVPRGKQWVTLAIDAEAVGLVGRYLDSVRYVTLGGTAKWGRTILQTPEGEQGWIDGAFPLTAGRGRDWQWVASPGRPGERAHRTIDVSAERKYSFRFVRPIPLVAGAKLRQWVYLPPGQEPSRIGITPGARTRSHYWGRLKAYDNPERSWLWRGPIPRPGRWAQIEVPLESKLDAIGFVTWTGAALWGKTEILGCDPEFELGDDFHLDYGTDRWPDPATIGTNAMGNQFFLGQTPTVCLSVSNPAASAKRFTGRLEFLDAYGRLDLTRPVACELPPEGIGIAEVPCENLEKGFYHVRLLDDAGKELCSTSLSILPRHVNLIDKDIFIYSNSGYVVEQLRFFDVLGGRWCRSIAVEQEMHRIEAFDTSPVGGQKGGTAEVVEGYRRALKGAARKKSTPHHTQYWFNISSNEMNLSWHNLERWSEVIRSVTIGLKQTDPLCVVSTPEINSVAMGFMDKLGENHTFDYLDFYFAYGCSLPVPPECMNKYWSFDIDSIAEIEERFGRRLTLTGMQYSTGNIGRAWGIPEEHQATYYVRGDILRRTRDVDYIAYFKFRECPNVNIYEVKDAINHADLSPKPAFVAMCSNFAKMHRSRYRGRLLLGTGNHAYLFDRPSGPILVLWTTEPVPQKVYLNLHASNVVVTDLYGRERQVRAAGGLLPFTITGDVQYIEDVGPEVAEESHFQPAPLFDARDLARRKLKELFIAVDTKRGDQLNFGGGRRGGRGDLVMTAGATFPLRVNVYNFSLKPATIQVRLSLPGGLEDKTGKQSCQLGPGGATTLSYTVQVPVNREPGLGKIRALASADEVELDPFTTDILVRSPLEVLPLEAVPKPGTPIRVRFTNATDAPVDARVGLRLPLNWQTEKIENHLSKVPAGETIEAEFLLTEAKVKPFHRYALGAYAKIGSLEAEYETSLDLAAVQPTDQSVHLDGSLDEWFASAPLYCGQRGNDYIYNTLSQILDPVNFSIRCRTLYDKDNLYLSLDVWDDQICEEDTKHGLLWDLDSVQIDFDADGDGKLDERVSVSCMGRSYIEPSDPRGDREPMITGTKGLARVASRVFLEPTATHPRGSVMELAIPWSWFQKVAFTPKPGARLGIRIFCVDEDVRAWSARPWKFDVGRKAVYVPFVLGSPVKGVTPSDWSPKARLARKVFARAPGDIASHKVKEAGLVWGPYVAGKAERFATTGLDPENRAEAHRLWFYGPGFVEYEHDLIDWKAPTKIKAIEFAAELASCYRPGNTHYALPGNATRVRISIAGTEIGHIDVLGDPGVDGWLYRLRVEGSGTFFRGKRISQVTLDSLLPRLKGKVGVRLTAEGLAGNAGGLNIHGPRGSGIHGLDPSLIVIYEP